jgi:hypothetical protein
VGTVILVVVVLVVGVLVVVDEVVHGQPLLLLLLVVFEVLSVVTPELPGFVVVVSGVVVLVVGVVALDDPPFGSRNIAPASATIRAAATTATIIMGFLFRICAPKLQL